MCGPWNRTLSEWLLCNRWLYLRSLWHTSACPCDNLWPIQAKDHEIWTRGLKHFGISLHAKFFMGNIHMCLQFLSFLHADTSHTTQVVEILSHVRQELLYSTYRQISNVIVSYNGDSFWKFLWEMTQTQSVPYIGSFVKPNNGPCNIGVLTVSDIRWSCGRAIFQGNRVIKTSKTSSLLDHNIVSEILEH